MGLPFFIGEVESEPLDGTEALEGLDSLRLKVFYRLGKGSFFEICLLRALTDSITSSIPGIF
jgi:hypothetical protein